MICLGIETSCDETSVGIVERKSLNSNLLEILSLNTLSSLRIHSQFGGIIPEIAQRKQLEYINIALKKSLKDAGLSIKDIDIIGVVYEPGLIGSLLVGINYARALSFSLNKPLIKVNHLHAHLYTPFFLREKPDYPFLGLVVSGGHTNLFKVRNFDKIEEIGRTRDDACGESFDKVAKILGLGFPGGPLIDKMANSVRNSSFKFRCAQLKGSLDFSFSGIKTAIFYQVEKLKEKNQLTLKAKREIAFSFQREVISSLIEKIREASHLKGLKNIVCGGGVVANSHLRKELKRLKKEGLKVYVSPPKLCQDNGAGVAGLALELYRLRN